jgi:hypothetical protein
VSTPVFINVLAELKSRITSISVANGYHLELGQSVQVEGMGPVDLDKDGQPLPGHVVIDPGTASSSTGGSESDSSVRMHTVPRESIDERNARIVLAIPVEAGDVDSWILIAEQAGEDLRKAIYADEHRWLDLFVTRIAQSELRAQRPNPGSKALMVAFSLTIRYHSQPL